MNEKEFKKHLHDLVHGHHHPEEHDWPERGSRAAKAKPARKRATTAKRKRAAK